MRRFDNRNSEKRKLKEEIKQFFEEQSQEHQEKMKELWAIDSYFLDNYWLEDYWPDSWKK